MDAIKKYLDKMFSSLPDSEAVRKAKTELYQMMEDKYIELKSEGKTEKEASDIVISEFGNLDELAASLGIEKEFKAKAKARKRNIILGSTAGAIAAAAICFFVVFAAVKSVNTAKNRIQYYAQNKESTSNDSAKRNYSDNEKDSSINITINGVPVDSDKGMKILGDGLSIGMNALSAGLNAVSDGLSEGSESFSDVMDDFSDAVDDFSDSLSDSLDSLSESIDEIKDSASITINKKNKNSGDNEIGKLSMDKSYPLIGRCAVPEFTNIEANVKVMEIDIEKGKDFIVSWSCNRDYLKPEFDVRNGKLYITQNNYRNQNGNQNCNIKITIPENTEIAQVKLTSNVGEIHINDMTISACTLKTNVGEISVENCCFTNLVAETNIGDIDVNLESDDANYEMDLTTKVGEINLPGKKVIQKYKQNGSKGKLVLSTNVGNIEIN